MPGQGRAGPSSVTWNPARRRSGHHKRRRGGPRFSDVVGQVAGNTEAAVRAFAARGRRVRFRSRLGDAQARGAWTRFQAPVELGTARWPHQARGRRTHGCWQRRAREKKNCEPRIGEDPPRRGPRRRRNAARPPSMVNVDDVASAARRIRSKANGRSFCFQCLRDDCPGSACAD